MHGGIPRSGSRRGYIGQKKCAKTNIQPRHHMSSNKTKHSDKKIKTASRSIDVDNLHPKGRTIVSASKPDKKSKNFGTLENQKIQNMMEPEEEQCYLCFQTARPYKRLYHCHYCAQPMCFMCIYALSLECFSICRKCRIDKKFYDMNIRERKRRLSEDE